MNIHVDKHTDRLMSKILLALDEIKLFFSYFFIHMYFVERPVTKGDLQRGRRGGGKFNTGVNYVSDIDEHIRAIPQKSPPPPRLYFLEEKFFQPEIDETCCNLLILVFQQKNYGASEPILVPYES